LFLARFESGLEFLAMWRRRREKELDMALVVSPGKTLVYGLL